MGTEEDEEDAVKGAKPKAVSEFDFLSVKGGKKSKTKVVDDVLGDDGERGEMELDSLIEMDEERAEGWDHEEDVANDDLAVTVDPDLEKEQNENEASRLEDEILKDTRAKEKEGIAVDDEEIPDFDADDDMIAERQEKHQEQRQLKEEVRKKLKAAGLEDEDGFSDEEPEQEAGTSKPGSSAGTPSEPASPDLQGARALTNGDMRGAPGSAAGSKGESAGTKKGKSAAKRQLSGDAAPTAAKRQKGSNSQTPTPVGTPGAGSIESSQHADGPPPSAPVAAAPELPEEMYTKMRAIITNYLQQNGSLMIPKILELLKAPGLPWSALPLRDKYIGMFVKLACGKMKHPKLQSFLLTEKRNAENKIIVELAPGAR